jgi:hypothetical protein
MKYLLLFLLSFMFSCQNINKPDYNYSKEETNQFLDEIAKNVKVTIGDITEIEKLPTDELYILTRYPLSKEILKEYNQNGHSIYNKDNDLPDFATYTFKDYELVNEKNEKLQFVNTGRAIYLQEGALWKYNNILCQNLSIEMKLDKKYEKIKGFITIVFQMPGFISTINRKVKIPVDVTIYDKVPE